MIPNPKTNEDLKHIRHQISNILNAEHSIDERLPSDLPMAQRLSKDNIQKLKALLDFIDNLSDGEGTA